MSLNSTSSVYQAVLKDYGSDIGVENYLLEYLLLQLNCFVVLNILQGDFSYVRSLDSFC